MKDIFFHERGKQILLELSDGDKYVSEVSNSIGATYAHTFNLINDMETQGIVVSNKKGRTKYVTLTPKGGELAVVLEQFMNLLNAPASKFKKNGKSRTRKKKKPSKSKAVEMAETPTNKRLFTYIESLQKLLNEVKSKKKIPKIAKYARLNGRYRSLVSKQRPRDQKGKDLKNEAIGLVEELSDVLESIKS